jgi:hemin uptake protein HemP
MVSNSLTSQMPAAGAATPAPAADLPPPLAAQKIIDVAALLGAEREAVLVHNGEPYRLRVTAKNRLILTK